MFGKPLDSELLAYENVIPVHSRGGGSEGERRERGGSEGERGRERERGGREEECLNFPGKHSPRPL